MIRVISAPFDGGGAKQGTALGPISIRLAGLEKALSFYGGGVIEWKEIEKNSGSTSDEGLKDFNEFLIGAQRLRTEVKETLASNQFPIVLGGEHSISIGSIAGALSYHSDHSLGVLWIDAHADLNTPNRSETKNLHGMPVAALCGFESESEGLIAKQWDKLLDLVSGDSAPFLTRLAWIGLRDVDKGEIDFIEKHPEWLAISMFDIDRSGIVLQMERVDQWLRKEKITRLWISFDVDSLDPVLAPGTGTAVRGGLSYREAHLMAELIRQSLDQKDCPYQLVGLDVVETNPLEDVRNSTAKMAVEWLASLFGKTILGKGNGR